MAVIPTWNVPTAVNVHESVELPEPVKLVGDMLHEVLLVARATRPVNPLTAVTVEVDAPEELTLTVTLAGLAIRVKS